MQQLRLLLSPPFFHQYVERVEEGVERRVERQHEDGHGHVDLARDGDASRGQQTQQTDGEPAQQVGHDDGDQTTGDDHVLGLSRRVRRHDVGPDGKADDGLARSDEEDDDEVEDDDDGEGVPASCERLAADGQWETGGALAVELPVPGRGEQGNGSQKDSFKKKGIY